jgi:hypothetical protein
MGIAGRLDFYRSAVPMLRGLVEEITAPVLARTCYFADPEDDLSLRSLSVSGRDCSSGAQSTGWQGPEIVAPVLRHFNVN